MYIEKLLQESYRDICNSIVEFGLDIPKYEEIKEDFYSAIRQGVKVSVINAKDDINKYLDEDTGELKLRTPFSIFVGGQVLDRGITIPNMVGFYYARNPKTMQQDTVMQHSRMFGYRDKQLLSITRFYTTRKIYESMVKITEIDVALRDDIKHNRFEDGICFIERKEDNGVMTRIVPCSPSKISVSNVVYLKPLSRILPIGFLPKAKAISDKVVRDVSLMIDDIMPREQKNEVVIDIVKAEKLIEQVYICLVPDENTDRFVEYDEMISILKYVSKQEDKCNLIVRRNRNISKYRDGMRYMDSPDNGQDERKLAREISVDMPTLTLLHQNGVAEGWKSREFWWPILTLPKNTPKTIYALPDVGGR